MKITRFAAALAAALMLGAAPCLAAGSGALVQGTVVNRSSVSGSAAIATGNTFQQLLPSIVSSSSAIRQALQIQNNNTSTDNCFLLIGGPWQAGDTLSTSRTINGNSITAATDAILLQPGQALTRYWPFVPSDQILGTCTTNGDTIHVDTQ